MKTANISELKNNLSKFIGMAEKGEVVIIHKRNVPIALITPYGTQQSPNRTKLGCGLRTVQIKGDLTEPFIPHPNG